MHSLELYLSGDGPKMERKNTFPMHSWSADRSPPAKNVIWDRKDFDEAAADGALPLAWASAGSKSLRAGLFPSWIH